MRSQGKTPAKKLYRAPKMTILGPLEAMTQQDKKLGVSDGIFLLGVGDIQNNS